MHIADLNVATALQALRWQPSRSENPGLLWGNTCITAALSRGRLESLPRLRRIALVAAWKDDGALDRFLAEDDLARVLENGWQIRLDPVRTVGTWSALPDLPTNGPAIDGPVVVLTLGRLRFGRAAAFLAASAGAERAAATHPDLIAGTGMARLPRFVATFSLWRDSESMRDYAVGRTPGAHLRAIRAHNIRPFHHESAFVRLRPYAAIGSWNGHDPLAAALAGSSHDTAT